jgi:hypothetical protein
VTNSSYISLTPTSLTSTYVGAGGGGCLSAKQNILNPRKKNMVVCVFADGQPHRHLKLLPGLETVNLCMSILTNVKQVQVGPFLTKLISMIL